VKAELETRRLALRRPLAADAALIFERYATDPDVTRFVAFPRHTSVDQTRAFLRFSDAEWERWGCGPLLVFSRTNGALLGGTGLAFETPYRASTGYVFARDAWGRGYATETLTAMVDWARSLGVWRLYAECHVDHKASARVLEKCRFEREGVLKCHTVFPNLSAEPADVFLYARVLQKRDNR
jgi:RimJ/RimL family protein N-acetyltransferase